MFAKSESKNGTTFYLLSLDFSSLNVVLVKN